MNAILEALFALLKVVGNEEAPARDLDMSATAQMDRKQQVRKALAKYELEEDEVLKVLAWLHGAATQLGNLYTGVIGKAAKRKAAKAVPPPLRPPQN